MAVTFRTEWKSAWRYAYNVYVGAPKKSLGMWIGVVYRGHDGYWHALSRLEGRRIVNAEGIEMFFTTRREAGEALAVVMR